MLRFSARVKSYMLLFYMLAAFGWWALHLWQMNDALERAQVALLEKKYEKSGVNLTELRQTAEYRRVEAKHDKKQWMILGEGVFFSLLLVYGWSAFDRGAQRELQLARQRRNFMLSITHELKSPIASLRLVLETICKRHQDLSEEQTKKLCANGLRESARLHGLVEDLLLAARLEDNWRPLPEPVDLSALAADTVKSLLVRFPQANVRIKIAENFPPVQADRSGLAAVVSNLLENAIKYSPEGAPVELSAERVDQQLRLRVSDQGYGIPKHEKQAVFEKFYRLGNEETRRATGTGLGLYIVRQVVRAHGGQIDVTDNQPQGTVFTLELP